MYLLAGDLMSGNLKIKEAGHSHNMNLGHATPVL